jgi:hypothetical protein
VRSELEGGTALQAPPPPTTAFSDLPHIEERKHSVVFILNIHTGTFNWFWGTFTP